MSKVGFSAVSSYFGLYYFLVLVLMAFYGAHDNFTNDGNVLFVLVILMIISLLTFLFSFLKFSLPISLFSILPNIFESKFLYIIGLVFFPVALNFFHNYGISFRYSGESLSDAGVVPKLVTLYKSFFIAVVIYSFFLIVNDFGISKSCRLGLLINALNWTLCANGAVDILWLVVAYVILFQNKKSARLFVKKRVTLSFKLLASKIINILLVFGAAAGVIFFGFANKMGVEAALDLFQNDLFGKVVYYMYYRLSVFTSSLEITLGHIFEPEFQLIALSSEFDVLKYRIYKIFALPIEVPPLEGISRFNYLNLFKSPSNSDAGTAPGPIATFLYIPFFPINLIFCSIYISLVINTYSRVLRVSNRSSFTLFSHILFLVMNFAFFHNPISSFLKIGPELFRTLMYLYVFGCMLKKVRSSYDER